MWLQRLRKTHINRSFECVLEDMKSLWLSKYLLLKSLFFCHITFYCATARAQTAKSLTNNGIKLMKKGKLLSARTTFLRALEADSTYDVAKYNLAICYLNIRKSEKALQHLKELRGSSVAKTTAYRFYLAKAYYQNEKFDLALLAINESEQITATLKKDWTSLKQHIIRVKEYYNNPQKIIVKNLGAEVNSLFSDYSPVMTADYQSIWFTSRRENNQHSRTGPDGHFYEKIYTTSIDNNGLWKPPSLVDIGENANHFATVQLLDHDSTMVFYYEGDLFFTESKKNTWKKKLPLSMINTEGLETHCFLVDDDKTIYFNTDFFSKDDNLDLYAIRLNDQDEWSEPQALTQLNTPFDEDAPFMDKVGNFYFSSKGHNSMGGYDIFCTRYDENTKKWDIPKNMGVPINSIADDIYFTHFGKIGYFSSSRLGGYGSLDIYQVLFFDKVKIQGETIDTEDNVLPATVFKLKHARNLYQAVSDVNGAYALYVPIDETFDVSIVKDDSTVLNEKYKVKVSFNDAENNRYNSYVALNDHRRHMLPVSKKITKIESKITQLAAAQKNAFAPILSHSQKKYLEAIEKSIAEKEKKQQQGIEHELYGPSTHVLDSIYNEIITNNSINHIFLAEDEVSNKRVVKFFKKPNLEDLIAASQTPTFQPLYLHKQSGRIKKNFMNELRSAANYLKKHPSSKIEVGGHTDNLASYEKNIEISEINAFIVARYLRRIGVKSKQINVKAYGESRPLISNATQKGRLRNTRVELVLLQQSPK